MSILELDNVSYAYQNRYQTTHAVNSVTTQFERGRTYAVVGKSGSGKTTLISLMSALDFPTSGTIKYDGEPIVSMDCDQYRRDHVAMIYQSYNLFLQLTALENVMCPLMLKKVPKEEARKEAIRRLAQIGLTEQFHNRFPSMLSGGEQQRVAIARTLCSGVDLILADEPTGNLDSENSAAIIDILSSLARDENACVIIVTHDQAIEEKMDVVLRMADGKLVKN